MTSRIQLFKIWFMYFQRETVSTALEYRDNYVNYEKMKLAIEDLA